MATEDMNVDALNQGLNTPTDDDPYAQNEEESNDSDSEDDGAEESEEEGAETVEATAQDEPEDHEEEAKPLTRGQQRIQALANEKRLAEQRAELLERELHHARQQSAPVRQQEEENLTDLEKWQRQADATIRQVQFQNMDMQDRSNFLTNVSKNPAEAAYIDRVEQTLAEARQRGFNPTRDDVLIRLMGLDARSKIKSAPAVKRDAAQRVSAAKGKPLANKSNVAPTKTEGTEFDRLRGIIL
ncbi:MAG: hypothetical protein V4621_08040 [Pseudomonadota bacterium]